MLNHGHMDDLPKRSISHDTEQAAIDVFHASISKANLFHIQKVDNNDYGTDVQIEARINDSMSNVHIHVQLS